MGKTRAARSLADQLAEFEDPTPKGMTTLSLVPQEQRAHSTSRL